MAHFAKLNENNIVTFVTFGRDEDNEHDLTQRTGDVYKQTSYNTIGGIHYTNGEPSSDQSKAFRKNFAGVGYFYDEERDAFIPPKPFPSWILDEDKCLWSPPVGYPDTFQTHQWNEEKLSWEPVTEV